MSHGSIALIAIYVPLVVVAAWAVWLYGRSILWPAIRQGKFAIAEHGIVLAMVATLSADVIEQGYWMTARILPNHWDKLSWAVPAVFSMKLIAMTGAMCAISAWHQAVDGKGIMRRLAGIVLLLYAGAYVTLAYMMR